MSVMIHRQRAAQSVIDRFSGRAFAWGKVDCASLAAHNLHNLGIACRFMKGAKYRTERGAVDHLASLGFTSLIAAVDGLGLTRIPPAMAVMGDLIGLPGEGEFWDVALTVAVGNGRVIGIQGGFCSPLQPDLSQAVTAWRCEPCLK